MAALHKREQIAWQLVLLANKHPEKTISELARMLAYPPLFIIAGLEYGEAELLFSRNREDDMIYPRKSALQAYDRTADSSALLGDEIDEVQNEIIYVLKVNNERYDDIETGKLAYWLQGVSTGAQEIALEGLKRDGLIDVYELPDPKDAKSVYEFITLPQNADNKWGKKQFSNNEE